MGKVFGSIQENSLGSSMAKQKKHIKLLYVVIAIVGIVLLALAFLSIKKVQVNKQVLGGATLTEEKILEENAVLQGDYAATEAETLDRIATEQDNFLKTEGGYKHEPITIKNGQEYAVNVYKSGKGVGYWVAFYKTVHTERVTATGTDIYDTNYVKSVGYGPDAEIFTSDWLTTNNK